MKQFSIRYILENIKYFQGCLYLKDFPWTLDTEGFFYVEDIDISPEEEEKTQKKFSDNGWQSTLYKEDIEDVISNTCAQLKFPLISQFFDAFVFFFENDAFKEW